MRDLLLALFWLVAIPLAFVSPPAGAAFWVWDALLSPTELVYSFMASVPTNKLAAAVTLFGLITKSQRRDIYIDRTGTILISLIVCATISWQTPVFSWDGDTELYLKVIKEIVLAFSIMFLITNQRWIHVCVFIVVISISFLGVKEGLISLLTVGGHKIIGSRAIGDNNQLAAALVVVIPLAVFLYKQVENGFIRIGLVIAMFLDLMTVIMSLSRGGFVGLICLGFLYLIKSKQRFRTIIIMSVLVCIFYALAPAAWFTRVDTINDAYDDSSFMGRVVAWKISWLIAEDNPLFGGGMHAVQHWSVWAHYSLYLSKLSWIPTPPPDIYPHAAHSIIFEVLGDLGFIGLTLYSLLFIVSYTNLKKVHRIGQNLPELQWATDLSQSMRFSLILYLLTGLLLSVAYFELLFVLFALSSCCLRVVCKQRVPPLSVSSDAALRQKVYISHSLQPTAADVNMPRRRKYLL